ncbi:hypothetical protein ACOSQ2_002099 [Xanthoceras sorbifolium]
MQRPQNSHMDSDVNLKDGWFDDTSALHMNLDEPLPSQNRVVDADSTKPTRWKRIAREAKTGVSGPEKVAMKKGKRVIEL